MGILCALETRGNLPKDEAFNRIKVLWKDLKKTKKTQEKREKMSDNINFNIWDDYYDDGNVPEGKIQSTYGYIESEIDNNIQEEILNVILHYLKDLDILKDVIVQKNGTDIEFENLTHVKRENLLKVLQSSNLKFDDKIISFYSES